MVASVTSEAYNGLSSLESTTLSLAFSSGKLRAQCPDQDIRKMNYWQ